MMAKISRSKVGTIDIVEVIDGHPIGSFQIKLILLCGLVAMLDGFDTQSIGFVAPIIAPALGININAFGPIFSSNLIGMAIGAMVLGPLADRVGRKAIITLSTFAFGLFSLLTILVDSSASLMTYRFFTGLGLGAAMPNIIALPPQAMRRLSAPTRRCARTTSRYPSTGAGRRGSWHQLRVTLPHAIFLDEMVPKHASFVVGDNVLA